MSLITVLIVFVLFVIIMMVYFKIADYYNIIDRPNERSSHTEVTIRGGGIIFLFAAIFGLILHHEFWMPILGMLVIGIISFLDDRVTLSSKIRFLFHLIAVSLLFFSVNVFGLFPWWISGMLYILVIGIINAYNFMDGINGITGLYSFLVLAGLQYVNMKVISFIQPDMIWLPILAVIVFLFFNFRKKAKCFAGDVGSITISFYIVFLLLKLILLTGNYSYILFLAVYGVDSVLTIFHRVVLKQNIFKPHRLHFYQVLANDQKWPHLLVSTIYALMQLGIMALVIHWSNGFLPLFLIILLPLISIYCIKPGLMEKTK